MRSFEAPMLTTSQRSRIPAFEVMRITDQIEARRAAGHDVISLCAGEPSPRTPPVRITGGGYTGPLGTLELREKIAQHYDNWYSVAIHPHRVAATTGSSGAFQLAFLAAFDAGDKVALATPGYPAYRNILRALGVQVIELIVGAETRYQPTPELLDQAVSEHGELAGLVVASPANPTGTMLGEQELKALVEWCDRNNARLVSDEIYHGITFAESARSTYRGVTAAAFTDQAIIINSFSKYWGMTGWRLGWAVLPQHLVEPVEALSSNFALSPPTPAQEFALNAFTPEAYAERDEQVECFARARSLILEAAPALNWGTAAPADGAFYYYSHLGEQLERFGDSTKYAEALLNEANVAVVPGTDFDTLNGNQTVRLSYAVGEEKVAEALERIIRFQSA